MSLSRILFVDDEANILDGLQNILRKQRRIWDTVFALGGPAALAELDRAPVDVIVSDMRMPGMDGAELLQRVQHDHPSVARIMLTGHAEREAVVRALPVAHQFLSKPCEGESLRIVLERTCKLQTVLKDDAIRTLVGKIDKLPSAPESYWTLTKAIAKDNIGCAEIARIVERDPAMSAKVLQLVNSAYFGLGQHVTSIQDAVFHLGVGLLQGLALASHVFSTMENVAVEGFSLDGLQKQSLLTARLAKRLVSDPRRADEAFATGIVHDIGKIVLALGFRERFSEVVRASRETQRPFHEIEREMLGVTHAEVGAYLLGVWGLPFTIIEAVAYHHSPGFVTAGERDVLGALHVAATLVETESEPKAGHILDIGFLESIGRAAELPKWRAMASDAVHAAGNVS
jgi:HD-like signal output (HDOD) protein